MPVDSINFAVQYWIRQSISSLSFRESALGNDVSAVEVNGNQVSLGGPNNVMAMSMTSSMLETSLNGSMTATSTPNRTGKGHKFTFDYAYWSHNKSDPHFADQSKVIWHFSKQIISAISSAENKRMMSF